GDTHDIWEVSAEGGAPRRVTTEGQALLGGISPDGGTLYYQSDVSSQQMYAYDLESGAKRRLTHTLDVFAASVPTPDGRQLLMIVRRRGQDRTQVVALALESGEERLIAEGQGVAVSPDGREIVIAAAMGAEKTRIFALPRAGGPERPVVEVDGVVAG